MITYGVHSLRRTQGTVNATLATLEMLARQHDGEIADNQ
jgi:hypothetical protein